MSNDFEKEKTKDELENLGRLVDRYAQSRSLELLIWFCFLVVNSILMFKLGWLMFLKETWWWPWMIMILIGVWFFLSFWLVFKVLKKYGYVFYKKEGQIELEKEKIPIWAWGTYLITGLTATFLSASNIMPVRWALVVLLISVGVLYVDRSHG